MNLCLGPEAESALRREAARSGRSQQESVRDAVERALSWAPQPASLGLSAALEQGGLLAPRIPFRRASDRVRLEAGVRSEDLLDRTERR